MTKRKRPGDEENLKKFYKYVYTCKSCKRKYGNDKIEKPPLLCPFCDLTKDYFN